MPDDTPPLVDISINKNMAVLWIEVPGYTERNIKIILSQNVLIVKGQPNVDYVNVKKVFLQERLLDPFELLFNFQPEILESSPLNRNNITVKLLNGLLLINIGLE